MGLGTPKVGMQSEKQLYFVVPGPMAPLFWHCHWPKFGPTHRRFIPWKQSTDVAEPDVKDEEEYDGLSPFNGSIAYYLALTAPWALCHNSSWRYLYYADVCAFHHYPAWYPTHVPGNMDEVKQIPLIWEAGGKDLKPFRCFCCNYLWFRNLVIQLLSSSWTWNLWRLMDVSWKRRSLRNPWSSQRQGGCSSAIDVWIRSDREVCCGEGGCFSSTDRIKSIKDNL